MEAWLNHLKEFFTIFITAPFIFQLFCAALDAVLSVGHLHLQKKHILFQLLWIVVLFASMLLLCMLSNSFDNPTSFAFTPTLVVFSIIIPGVVFIALSGHSKWQNKLLKVFLYVSSAYVVTEITHQVNMLSFSIPSPLATFYRFLPSLLMPIAGALVGYYNINRYSEEEKSYFILSLAVFLALFVITFLSSSIETDSAYLRTFILVVLISFLITEIGIYLGLYATSKNQKKLLDLQAQAKLNEAAYETLKLNEESIERTSIARHDMKNHYAYIASLLEQKKYDEAYQYVSTVNEESYGNFHIIDCGNRILSSILNLELSKARIKGIQLKYFVAVPKELPFKETDLCSLLTNLIDNALEAIEREKNGGSVDIQIYTKGGYLRISITNPTNRKEINLKTTKESQGHGYGLKIIRSIVENYNGFLNMEIKDGMFETDIMMDMDSKGEKANASDSDDR